MPLTSPWRADFPALAALQRQGQVYLDNAATGQKPQAVIDCLQDYYGGGVANVHRSAHHLAERTTVAFEAVRQQLATWLGAASAEQIILTRNATEAFNLLAYGLEHRFAPGDELAISALEHHANLLPWQQLARRKQLKLVILPLTAQGDIDTTAAASLIGPHTRLLAVSQFSTVLGRPQPLTQLLALARQHGALTVVDGAQGVVHQHTDLSALGCDFYAFSGHKLYGPEGVGVLYGRPQALALLQHWQFGGEMPRQVSYEEASFYPPPLGFEAGTPAIGPVLSLGAALEYLSGADWPAMLAYQEALFRQLLKGLQSRPLQLLGAPSCALASFTVAGADCGDLAQLLAEQGLAVRAGSHCAMPLHQYLGVTGSLRVSLAPYNDESDLERFFAALDKALELLA